MARRKLNQYSGTLDSSQTAEGINAAKRNARRLAGDAEFLLKNGRFPSATALAILSIEESGKASILRRLATAADAEQLKKCWREYRSHTAKNVTGAFVDLVAQGARRLVDFSPLFDSASEYPELLDQVKQLSFYSDCLGDGHWSEPAATIEEPLARAMVLSARSLATEGEVSPLEIELWIMHVGPHLTGSPEQAERALEVWYAALQERGLRSAGQNRMAEFINVGLDSPPPADTTMTEQ